MPAYSLDFAAVHLSALVSRAEAGEEITLARGEESVVRLVPVSCEQPRDRQRGRLAGKVWIGPEFFEPLPEEELRAWEGGD